MPYEAVALYTLPGAFVGYTIRDPQKPKLQTTNIYSEQEEEQLAQRLAELNKSVEVHAAWPDARDPEVLALVNDPSFEPIEMGEHQVIDEDASFLVWEQTPEVDKYGKETDNTIDGENLDLAASVIVYKAITAPVRPSDVVERTHKAQEAVANRRVDRA